MDQLRTLFSALAAGVTISVAMNTGIVFAAEEGAAVGTIEGAEMNLILSTNAPNASPQSITRYKKTLMAAYTEYNTGTCAEISPGSWTVTLDPKYGATSKGSITGHLGNGACPSQTFTFAAIYYEWTAHNNKSLTDVFDATWKTPDGLFTYPFVFNVKVPVVRPASETTAFVDWDPVGLTDGRWKQTLQPPPSDPTFSFAGESVREADAAGTHSDTCWFPTSAFKKFDMITGGTWPVAAGNTWEFDHVGWYHSAVTYYRLKHGTVPPSAPCKSSFPQQMTIKPPPEPSYSNYAGINQLGGGIGRTTVTSIRAGSSQTETWP